MISTGPYVVPTIIETFFMVEFGLFREKTVDRSLRNNDKPSLNDVEDDYESHEKSKLKYRQYDVIQRSGRVRTEEDEDRFQARTAALELIGDDSAYPVEHCTTILAPIARTWHDPEKVVNYGTQKTRGPMPTVCTTV
ncbi:hypothetical protein VTO58DRAFT_108146 [Aureobasidium pullulans]